MEKGKGRRVLATEEFLLTLSLDTLDLPFPAFKQIA